MATNMTLAAWTSARVAFSHGSDANANEAPAIPAAAARSRVLRWFTRWPVIRATRPEAPATNTAERRFIRHATSPIGSRVHNQPRIS